MSRRDTIEVMQQLAASRGGECLSQRYRDQRTPLRWRCKRKHVWSARPADIKGSRSKRGTWCPTCARDQAADQRRQTLEQAQGVAREHGLELVSTEFLGTQIRHRYRCRDGHGFPMRPNAVGQGEGCPTCAGNAKPTIAELNELARAVARSSDASCVSTSYENSQALLEWSCGNPEHEHFHLTYRAVKHDGSWCKRCKDDTPRPRKYDRDCLLEIASAAKGELLTDEPYRSTKQSFRWRCVDRHEFARSVDKILATRSFCPECNRRGGLRERVVRQLFAHMFKKPFERTKRLRWLKNRRGNPMELDGFDADLRLAFEHQGQQHYEICRFADSPALLEKRRQDDAEKRRLCKKHGVTLIEIPWTMPMEEIQTFVLHQLAELEIEPVDASVHDPGLVARSELDRLRERAASRNGSLLSDRYMGSNHKHVFKCHRDEHPPFEATPNAILSNRWCRRCATERRGLAYRVAPDIVRGWAQNCGGDLSAQSLSVESFSLADSATFRCGRCQRDWTRTIRQVKAGRLCFCQTKKLRIDQAAVEARLIDVGARLVEPETIEGGKTVVLLECNACLMRWKVRAASVSSSSVGCPQCKKNAKVDLKKVRALGARLGFVALDDSVSDGKQVLAWRCSTCKTVVKRSYREMRNVRRCRACATKRIMQRSKK